MMVEIPSDRESGLVLHVNAAHVIVSEQLESKGLSEARLTLIEQYLAAHFAVIAEERGGLTSSQIGESRDSYIGGGNSQVYAGGGFSLTRFGQQAMGFDTSGTLTAMSKAKLPAQFKVAGTAQSVTSDVS
jgi:hypothetical protein